MERKPFEIKVGGRNLALSIGNCAVNLFRAKSEIDYLAVDVSEDEEEPSVLRVFNNVEFVRWMAGYSLAERDDNFYRPTARNSNLNNSTFRELFGWNPAVIEREEPSEAELEMWIDINTDDLDGEREW